MDLSASSNSTRQGCPPYLPPKVSETRPSWTTLTKWLERLTLLLTSVGASAQTAVPVNQQPVAPGAPSPPPQQPAVSPLLQSVTATADNQLLKPEATGSRLGLTPLETPAQIFSITPDTIERRGYNQIEDAVDSLPGVTSGGSPADPSQFVLRGFVGNYVSLLRDGIYVGPANMVTRAENAFNPRSIDVLSGPGSVLYGQGAVGGTVNILTKKPLFVPVSFDAYSELSSFSTFEEVLGVGGQSAELSPSVVISATTRVMDTWSTQTRTISMAQVRSCMCRPTT